MQATVILPVKRFGDAKQRLLTALDRPQRAALVKAMLTDALVGATDARNVERVIVVTSEGRAERLALSHARRTATPIEVFEEPGIAGTRRRPLSASSGRRPSAQAAWRSCPGTARCSTPTSSTRRSSECARAGSPSSPTAMGPEPTRSSCRRPTRSARRSGRAAARGTASGPSGPDTRLRSSHSPRSRSTSTRRRTSQQMAVILESGPDRAPTTAEALKAIGDVASGARE